MSAPIRVCFAGTFDPDVPRNRILIECLRRGGAEVTIVRVPLWGRREHDIVRRGRLRIVGRALRAYPWLVARLLAAPLPQVVIVGYPGHFDVPFAAFVARLRGARLAFDPYLSLFDTIVADRRLASPGSPTARLAAAVDRVSCRLADLVLADTTENADDLAVRTGVPRARIRVLPIGAEESIFHPRPDVPELPGRVLFYGTFIPLHGVTTIVRAAKRLEREPITIRIVGTGQERAEVERLRGELGLRNLEIVEPVPLESLPLEIARATLCLGIFGTSEKAGRVIPNKVFQCLAVGRPVLTGDTPAIRRAFTGEEVGTVAPGDPLALAAAIRRLVADAPAREALARAGRARYLRDYGLEALTKRLTETIRELVAGNPGETGSATGPSPRA